LVRLHEFWDAFREDQLREIVNIVDATKQRSLSGMPFPLSCVSLIVEYANCWSDFLFKQAISKPCYLSFEEDTGGSLCTYVLKGFQNDPDNQYVLLKNALDFVVKDYLKNHKLNWIIRYEIDRRAPSSSRFRKQFTGNVLVMKQSMDYRHLGWFSKFPHR